jgi:ubiquinone/menaquinone biosynthesis C-methylase UbiE
MIFENRLAQALYDATWGRFAFAQCYDWFLRRAEKEGLAAQRRTLLSFAKGRTLEIGSGTGLNLPHYPAAVTQLVLSEAYRHMLAILRRKVASAKRPAFVVEASAEELPFPDASFDTVVGTMVLCTAAEPARVLREVARVLRPGGQYLFLEHIRHPDPRVARRQDRWQPAWYLFGNGCHCNRDTVTTLLESSFLIEELQHGRIPGVWAIVEPMVSGRARRPAAK